MSCAWRFPGVQVLFAFLLILPFQQGFADSSAEDQAVYTLALLFTALAAALLIAPSMYHRLNFRRGQKERMLFDSNKLMVAGVIADRRLRSRAASTWSST